MSNCDFSDQFSEQLDVPGIAEKDDTHRSRTGNGRATREAEGVSLDDFKAYMPQHSYIFIPSRELWPAASVNARLPRIIGPGGGPISPTKWLDTNAAVEQMTWAPGKPLLIENSLISDGGWIERPGCTVFNLYRPPTIVPEVGNVVPWLNLVRTVFPNEANHVVQWFAPCREAKTCIGRSTIPGCRIRTSAGSWQSCGPGRIKALAGPVTTWNEFDLERLIWNVPPEKLKTGHLIGQVRPVPITPPMLAVLEEMKRRRKDDAPNALVFPSPRGGEYEINTCSRFIRHALKWEAKTTVHGFRSTFVDWARANRFPAHLIDLQLDHVLGNKVGQAYGHDKLIEERRAMMRQWGNYCSRPAPVPATGTDNVLSLAKRRKKA